MAIIIKEKRYTATESFKAKVALSGEEFLALGESDGLDPENRISRKYVAAEDGSVSTDTFPAPIKKDQQIKDVHFARAGIRQGAPIAVHLEVKFAAGQAIPEHIGAPLAEAGHPKVAVTEFLPGEEPEQEPTAPADAEPPAAPAKGASKAPAKGKE